MKQLEMSKSGIVSYAVGVKCLFSMMSGLKTKARNRMKPLTLEMMAQVKLDCLLDKPISSKTTDTEQVSTEFLSEYDQTKPYDSFVNPNDLALFEEGVFTTTQNAAEVSRQDEFMITMFD